MNECLCEEEEGGEMGGKGDASIQVKIFNVDVCSEGKKNLLS